MYSDLAVAMDLVPSTTGHLTIPRVRAQHGAQCQRDPEVPAGKRAALCE